MTRASPPLRGSTALVTGASRGIGRAVAEALAEAGATVYLLARSRDALEALATRIGGHVLAADLLEEIRGTGVTASLVEPSAVDTSLWDPVDPDRDPALPDRSRMLRPEDVADAILFVATRPPDVESPFLAVARG